MFRQLTEEAGHAEDAGEKYSEGDGQLVHGAERTSVLVRTGLRQHHRRHTVHQSYTRYDTRCYFNVRSKADISHCLIYRTERTTKKV